MTNFSNEAIIKNCPHCNPKSSAHKFPLQETENFWVVCDVHPLTKGHLLIIPKKHLSCIGEFPKHIYNEFISLYKTCINFIKSSYGSVSSFEHGKIGQTVFHSHIQMFPFNGNKKDIVPEGNKYYKKISNLNELKYIYQTQGSYLFFSIGDKQWVVDIKIGKPGFFRDRFAIAKQHPERGNWKEMHDNKKLMIEADIDIHDLINKWKQYQSNIT